MVYIWVRKTLNWADEEGALAQIAHPWIRSKVELWNRTFNISYQHFRARLAEIAALNHSAVTGATRSSWDQIPDGSLVLPVDDDDWFAPQAARVLDQELDSSTCGLVWDPHWIEVPINLRHALYLRRLRLVPGTRPTWICVTNNYALTKGPGARDLLGSHIQASREFERRLKDQSRSVKRVVAGLSVANRNLASQTSLDPSKPTISHARLIRKLRRYRRLYRRAPPAGVEWCRPYLAMMAELMAELRVEGS